jgi:hypothetical protein
MSKLNWQRRRFVGRKTLDFRHELDHDPAAKWLGIESRRPRRRHHSRADQRKPQQNQGQKVEGQLSPIENIEDNAGGPCPRCGRATEVRQHPSITAKELRRPYYFSRWFICRNPHCQTTVITREKDKVFNTEPKVQRTAIAEQLGESSNWITASSSTEVPW